MHCKNFSLLPNKLPLFSRQAHPHSPHQVASSCIEILKTNLFFYRKSHHWSQKKLAFYSGIPRSYLAELETGKRNPSIKKVIALACALHIPPWLLMKPVYYNPADPIQKYCDLKNQNVFRYHLYLSTENFFYKKLILNMIQFRQLHHWTQQDLADAACLSVSFIVAIETYKKTPTLLSVEKISNALQLQIWELLKNPFLESVWMEHAMWK